MEAGRSESVLLPEKRVHLPRVDRATTIPFKTSRDAFSGTVLLAKAGKPRFRAAFGEANKDFGVKNTIDTKCTLGSMNKMFTAAAFSAGGR